MKKASFATLLMVLLAMLSGCVYDVPAGYTRNHHSYVSALSYARSLDPDASVGTDHQDLEDEYGRRYREWPAVINGMDCHVCSGHNTVYDSTGEFSRVYYSMRNDHDYQLMRQLLNGLDDWQIREGVFERYHSSGNVYIYLLAPEDAPLSDDELRTYWQQTCALQAQYTPRSTGKPAVFCVPVPIMLRNANTLATSVGMSHLYFPDHTEEAWNEFLAEYHERWELKGH